MVEQDTDLRGAGVVALRATVTRSTEPPRDPAAICVAVALDVELRRRDGSAERWQPASTGDAINLSSGQVPEQTLGFWARSELDGDVLQDLRLHGYDGPPPTEQVAIQWSVDEDVRRGLSRAS